MDWVRVGGLVILPDGSVSEILSISEDNGILAKDSTQWFCRSELLPLTKENMVKTLNGVLPPEPHPDALLQDVPYNFYVYEEDVFCKWRIAVGWSSKKICTLLEFKRLATELNKEKQMTDWYDYENKTAISFPPVGSEVIVNTRELGDGFWPANYRVKVIAIDGDVVVYKYQDVYYSDRFYPHVFKPLDWEKDVRKDTLIDKAVQIMYDNACATKGELINGVKRLYDLGYLKFPEEK